MLSGWVGVKSPKMAPFMRYRLCYFNHLPRPCPSISQQCQAVTPCADPVRVPVRVPGPTPCAPCACDRAKPALSSSDRRCGGSAHWLSQETQAGSSLSGTVPSSACSVWNTQAHRSSGSVSAQGSPQWIDHCVPRTTLPEPFPMPCICFDTPTTCFTLICNEPLS